MQIIDDLEPTKRGVYGGVVGYVDFSGNLDTAIAIRTMVVTPDGRASVQAGAGIVADSDPAEEDVECHNKAAALLAAVPAARRRHAAGDRGPSATSSDPTPTDTGSTLIERSSLLREATGAVTLGRDVLRVSGADALAVPPGPAVPGRRRAGGGRIGRLADPDPPGQARRPGARVAHRRRRVDPRRRRGIRRGGGGAPGPLQAPGQGGHRAAGVALSWHCGVRARPRRRASGSGAGRR